MLRFPIVCLVVVGFLCLSACGSTDVDSALPTASGASTPELVPSADNPSSNYPINPPFSIPPVIETPVQTPAPGHTGFSYFINEEGIYRKDMKTQVKTKVTSNILDMLLHLGDCVYFTENGGIYSMNKAGEVRRIENRDCPYRAVAVFCGKKTF